MTVVDLVTHSNVEIAAQAVDVWPYVLEPNDWKQGLKPVHVSGERNGVGEVLVAFTEYEGHSYSLTVETVLQAPTRKVIRIVTGSALDPSWAAWQLQEAAGSTTVSYGVYAQLEIGDADPAEYVRGQQARFNAELLLLKELVESG